MQIDEKTKIPLFAAIGAATALVGIVLWITSTFASQEDLKSLRDLVIDVRERTIRIEQAQKDERLMLIKGIRK